MSKETIKATVTTNTPTLTKETPYYSLSVYSIKITPIFNDSTIDKGFVITKIPVKS